MPRLLHRILLSILLPTLLPAMVTAQEADARPQAQDQKQAVEEHGWRRVQLPVRKGGISALTLCRGIFDAYGLDGKQLSFKDRKLPVDSLISRLMLYGLEKGLKGKLDVRRKNNGKTIEFLIKEGSLSSGRRAAKKKILQALSAWTGEDLISRQFRLMVPDDLTSVKTLVILVHGLDSRPGFFDDLATHLESKGHRTGRYSYPNDDSISDSSKALSDKLRQLSKSHKDLEFVLIAHSMGGVLCREVVEDPKLQVDRIRAVAFLGTPHHGSYLSAYRSILDLRDNIRGGLTAKALLDTWRDGFGEAGHDLWPGSPYLKKLARLPRNPKVRYLNILGNKAPFSRDSLDKLAAQAEKLLAKSRWGRLILPRALEALEDLRELETGKGDCAVALARGHLEGVPEKILPLDHISLAKRKGILTPELAPDSHPAYRALLTFLKP